MDITRRSDYACRILRALCTHEGEFRSVAEIAREEDVPYSFARSIQHDLVKAGLLRTERGVHGGVAMALDCADVTLYDVMTAVQSKLGVSPCSQDPGYCAKSARCQYHGVWCKADAMLADYFKSISLADLFERKGACADGRADAVGAGVAAGEGGAVGVAGAASDGGEEPALADGEAL